VTQIVNGIMKDSINECYQITLDNCFFDLDSVRKVAYEYSGLYFVNVVLDSNDKIKVSLTPKDVTKDDEFFIKNFPNQVIDYQIKKKIDEETSKIKEIIVNYAYSSIKKN